MKCCLLSLSEVSAKRASFIDARPAKRGRVGESQPGADGAPHASGQAALPEVAAANGLGVQGSGGARVENAASGSGSAGSGPAQEPLVPLTPIELAAPATPPEGRA